MDPPCKTVPLNPYVCSVGQRPGDQQGGDVPQAEGLPPGHRDAQRNTKISLKGEKFVKNTIEFTMTRFLDLIRYFCMINM